MNLWLISQWGPNNEVYAVYVTWDVTFLYIGIDGNILTSDDMMVYIDSGQSHGFQDVSLIGTTYGRNIYFQNMAPDFFILANFSTASIYQITLPSPIPVLGLSSAASTFYNAVNGSLTAKIAWSSIYQGYSPPNIPANTTIKILACVTKSVGGSSTPDTAPDTTQPLPIQWNQLASVDSCLSIQVDSLALGIPDTNVNIFNRSTILNSTTLNLAPIKISDVTILHRAFSSKTACVEIDYTLSKDTVCDIRVYNLQGTLINVISDHISMPGGRHSLIWCGVDNNGMIQKPGLYVVDINATISGKTDIQRIGVYLLE